MIERPRLAFILCGALAREVLSIIKRHDWQVDVFGIPAIDHMYPDRIAPDVERKFQSIRSDYDHILVIFGDCGSRGKLDELLDRLQLDRVDGPHCYEMYGGDLFSELLEEEPGTFFLTDFLIRGFQGTIWRGLGLDRFPTLLDDYFRNYKRLVYLTQTNDQELLPKARSIAERLKLPLEVHFTGYGHLEARLGQWVSDHMH